MPTRVRLCAASRRQRARVCVRAPRWVLQCVQALQCVQHADCDDERTRWRDLANTVCDLWERRTRVHCQQHRAQFAVRVPAEKRQPVRLGVVGPSYAVPAGGSVESFRTGKTGNAEWKALGPGPGWRGNENSPGDEVVPRMAETVNTKHLIDNFTRRPLTPVAPPRAERCFQKEDGPPRKLECTTDRAHPPSQSQPQ
jgi:hypothetical protein